MKFSKLVSSSVKHVGYNWRFEIARNGYDWKFGIA